MWATLLIRKEGLRVVLNRNHLLSKVNSLLPPAPIAPYCRTLHLYDTLNIKTMLDQLIKLVQQNAGEAIVKNPAIPDEENNAAIQDVAQNILGGLKSQASQGNLEQITSMFKNGGASSLTNNPVVAGIIGNVAASLASKFGVSQATAHQIASGLLPKVMSQFVNKTNDPNDNDFDLQDMLGKFTGNGNVADMIGKGGLGDAIGGLGKMFK